MAARHAAFHPLEVEAVEELTDDAVAITFRVPDHLRDDYVFTAGQHLTIRCADGVRRSYSLCTPPSSGVLRIGVKQLTGGAFSEGVVPKLQPGDVLDVMTPAGRFTATPEPGFARTYAAVAAGSGITPVLSIVSALLEQEPDSCVTLVYANRTHRSVMFLDEVADLKDRFPDRLQVVHVLSREQGDVDLLSGRLDGERLTRILEALVPWRDVDAWYLCGPQEMVADLRTTLASMGVEESRLHSELFHAEPVARPRPVAISGAVDGASQVIVRLDGRSTEFPLAPDGPSVLEAAQAVRPDVPFACKGGVCGTCRARLVEGTVEMDANYALEPDEVAQGYVLTCQSHPTSATLVVDYDA